MRIPARMVSFVVLFVLSAPAVAAVVDRQMTDVGAVCVDAAPLGTPFPGRRAVDPGLPGIAPGDRLHVSVIMPGCRNSCVEGHATCEVTVTGPMLRISSAGYLRDSGAGYDFLLKGRRLCTSICLPLLARCQTPPLAAGTYQVRHGDDTLAVNVPSWPLMTPMCVGRR